MPWSENLKKLREAVDKAMETIEEIEREKEKEKAVDD